MSHAIRRHSGNYAAIVLLVFAAALGLDWLLVRFGMPPVVGCTLRPFLYLVMGLTVGTWMMTIGVILSLFAPSRPIGVALLLAGTVIGILPQLLEHYLAPLCRPG